MGPPLAGRWMLRDPSVLGLLGWKDAAAAEEALDLRCRRGPKPEAQVAVHVKELDLGYHIIQIYI